MSGPGLLSALFAKLVEEAVEVAWAPDRSLLEELADVLETIRSIGSEIGASLEDITLVADKKRTARGAFEDGIVLVDTVEDPLIALEEASQLDLRYPDLRRSSHLRVSPQATMVPGRQGVEVQVRDPDHLRLRLPYAPPVENPAERSIELGSQQHWRITISYLRDEMTVELTAEAETQKDQLQFW